MTTRSSYGLSLLASFVFHGVVVGLIVAVVASVRPSIVVRDRPAEPAPTLHISFDDGGAVQRGPVHAEQPGKHTASLSGGVPKPPQQPRRADIVSGRSVPLRPPGFAASSAPTRSPAIGTKPGKSPPLPVPGAQGLTAPVRQTALADGNHSQNPASERAVVTPGGRGAKQLGVAESGLGATSTSSEGRRRAARRDSDALQPAKSAQPSASGAALREASGQGGGSTRPVRLLSTLHPSYPFAARLRGWEGLVVLRLRIERDGEASSASIERSSGHRILDEAALSAAEHARFAAATRGDNPVATTILLPIRFRLDAARGE